MVHSDASIDSAVNEADSLVVIRGVARPNKYLSYRRETALQGGSLLAKNGRRYSASRSILNHSSLRYRYQSKASMRLFSY